MARRLALGCQSISQDACKRVRYELDSYLFGRLMQLEVAHRMIRGIHQLWLQAIYGGLAMRVKINEEIFTDNPEHHARLLAFRLVQSMAFGKLPDGKPA